MIDTLSLVAGPVSVGNDESNKEHHSKYDGIDDYARFKIVVHIKYLHCFGY